MIGDVYALYVYWGDKLVNVQYCRVLDETPRTVKVVVVRGSARPGVKTEERDGYGQGYPAPDARYVTKPFYLFKRDGCLVRGRRRYVFVPPPPLKQ
jgi:hypothetical protein